MRKFYNGIGSDSTDAVIAHLAAHRQLHIADLYVINTAPCYSGQYLGKQFLLTDYPSPLKWDWKGTFKPAVIKRSEIESKIGFEADTVDVTWNPKDTDILADDGGSPATTLLTVIQGFTAGCFDNGTLEIWRCLMPSPGDCNTLGACKMFFGRIGDLTPDRLGMKLTVIDRRETLNVQVPTVIIEPGNILTQYSVGVIPQGAPSIFAVLDGSTATKVISDPVLAPSGYTGENSTYDTGYIVVGSGARLGGTYRRVRQQTIEGGHHVFYLQEALPFAPTVGDNFTPYIPVPAGYSLEPFNEPFPAQQTAPDSTTWTWGLNGTTLSGDPSSHHLRTFGFAFHSGQNDVYSRTGGSGCSGFSCEWVVVAPDGTVSFPGSQPTQEEPGVGAPTLLGFPYVPIPTNSPMVF